MIIRRLLAVGVLLFAGLGLVAAAPSAQATCAPGEPRGENDPGERTIELLDTEAEAGGTIRFKVTGFVNKGGGGQTLNFKVNDSDPLLNNGLKVDDNGALTSEVKLPDVDQFREWSECGTNRWWIRFLVGSGADNDDPTSSYFREFRLTTDLTAVDPSPSSTPTSTAPTSTTTTPTTTSGTAPTTSGTLPKTGIEDHGVLLATGGLALAALLALVIDRRLRRRRLGVVE